MAKFTTDWIQAAIRDGRGFMINIGAFSTPIVGGGNGTVVDLDQPEGCISVPAGTSILPIFAKVTCTVPLLATDADESEIILAADIAAASAADGTHTSETALNMHTLHGRTSNCTCWSASTGDETDPTLGLELDHVQITGDVQGTAATALWTPLKMNYEPRNPIILNGPGALYVYWGGTVATSGFAQIGYLEFPTSYFS